MGFSNEVFIKYRDFINKNYGIFYSDVKREILRIKLDKCLVKSGVCSYEDFFKLLSFGREEYLRLLESEITVNKTGFFREASHFDFLVEYLQHSLESRPEIGRRGELRVWSAACSTGQEAYSLAVVLKDVLPPHIKLRILATDVSSRVLAIAGSGVYSSETVGEIPAYYLGKYFAREKDKLFVNSDIKQIISFRRFNLMDEFPFSGLFDIVFCRNVMIYFDGVSSQNIVDKIHTCMARGGLLFLGQSESLINKKHTFKLLKYSVYCKTGS